MNDLKLGWPQVTDYNAAVQNPHLCFADPDLRNGTTAIDAIGLPRLHSGNSADVYQVQGADGQAWAVKCFTRPAHGLQPRYQAISDHLGQVHRPFMVDFRYLEQGIRIRGEWFPTLKMHWVEGSSFNAFVQEHADKPAIMDRLAQMWQRLAQELREARMGHGDLQHGNVLLVAKASPAGGKYTSLALRLIDYDGMHVPALADQPSAEVGHPNYQHPQRLREGGYGEEVDRFAHLVTYTALRSLRVAGKPLWQTYDNGENLLFREDDFLRPGNSRLFRELWGLPDPEVQSLVGHLVLASQESLAATPLLTDLLGAQGRGPVRALTSDERRQVRSLLFPGARRVQAADTPAKAVAGRGTPTLDAPGGSGNLQRAMHEPPSEGSSAQRRALGSMRKDVTQDKPMANPAASIPSPNPEHRRVAAAQFERANQVVATGNYDYGIRLYLSCCKLDPANLIYRQALRRTEKAKYRNNLRGSRFAWITSWITRARLKAALSVRDYVRVLDQGEHILMRNPWNVGVQMDMAVAADALGLLDLAIWNLEQARQKLALDPTLNRMLARLYEQRGNFTQSIALWELVRKARPSEQEAQQKIKDLAADDTIARGQYGSTLNDKPQDAAGEGAPTAETPTATENALTDTAAVTPFTGSRVAREADPLRARWQADPTNTNACLQLARIYRRADEFDLARSVLEEGLGTTGNAFEVGLELADLEIEPFRRNLTIAEERLRTDPEDAELRKLRIRLRKEINTRELDLYRQKAERFPLEMQHRFEVGLRLLRANQVDEAIRELQTSRNDPRYRWQSLLYLGHCFKARKNWRLAQRNFEESLQNLPPNEATTRKDLLFELALGCAEAGELARAIDLGHELANVDFTYRDIGRLLDEWQDRLQNADV